MISVQFCRRRRALATRRAALQSLNKKNRNFIQHSLSVFHIYQDDKRRMERATIRMEAVWTQNCTVTNMNNEHMIGHLRKVPGVWYDKHARQYDTACSSSLRKRKKINDHCIFCIFVLYFFVFYLLARQIKIEDVIRICNDALRTNLFCEN